MKKYRIIYMIALLMTGIFSLSSCSEDDNTVEEYPDWKNTNTKYFNSLYTQAKQREEAGSDVWKTFRSYSLNEDLATDADDHIVVEILEKGTGSGCPLFTDSVRVHYRGRLLPSTSHPGGYVFDQSYYNDFNWQTAAPKTFCPASLVDGFATALQHMHVGDRWRVYIPSALGYGSTGNSSIPAYSTLIFDIALVEYFRPDATVPTFK